MSKATVNNENPIVLIRTSIFNILMRSIYSFIEIRPSHICIAQNLVLFNEADI